MAAEQGSGSQARGARWLGAESTPASPTGPRDYAILEAVFATGLLFVVRLARRRERDGREPVRARELPVLAIATFALADVVAKEKVSTWIREPFVQEGADHKPVAAEGSGLQHAIGELLTCTRCMGTWGALGLIGLRVGSPSTSRVVTGVLALTGVNDVLQSAFRLLSERTNAQVLANERAHHAADHGGATPGR